MAVNLQKGQRATLDNSMKMALVGLGWDPNKYDGGYDFDLDASAFVCGANGKVQSAFVAMIDARLKQTGKYTKNESKISFQDVQDCLIIVVSSFSNQTSYENQTKKSITNKFIQTAMTEFFRHQLEVWFIENPLEADKIGRLVDADQNDNALVLLGKSAEIHHDLFVVPFALAGEVVALVQHAAAHMAEIVEEYNVRAAFDFSFTVKKKSDRVAVDVLRPASEESPLLLRCVPAKTYHHSAKSGVALGQIDLLTLLKIDTHV